MCSIYDVFCSECRLRIGNACVSILTTISNPTAQAPSPPPPPPPPPHTHRWSGLGGLKSALRPGLAGGGGGGGGGPSGHPPQINRVCYASDIHVESPQAPTCWQPANGPVEVSVVENLSWVPRGMISLRQANVGNDMKNILYIWFSHVHWQRHIGARIIPRRCISVKPQDSQWGPCWPIYWESKPSLKLLDCGRKIQNDDHIDTCISDIS